MITLAFDTTAKTVTAALCRDRELIAYYTANGKNTHTETLLPAITELFRLSGLTMDDVGLVAVSAGPGSFTGVRIGAATAKGLAFGRELPCAGVSSLLALATNLIYTDGAICAAMDARRSQLYCAFFCSENGVIKRLTPDAALSCAEMTALAATLGFKDFTAVGDGAGIARNALCEKGFSAKVPHPLLQVQCAYSVALCGLDEYNKGNSVTADKLLPSYLRGFTSGNDAGNGSVNKTEASGTDSSGK